MTFIRAGKQSCQLFTWYFYKSTSAIVCVQILVTFTLIWASLMPKYIMVHTYQLLVSIVSVKNPLVLCRDNLPVCLLLLSSVGFNIWKKTPHLQSNLEVVLLEIVLWKAGKASKLNVTPSDESSAKPPPSRDFRAQELDGGARPQHSGV